MESGQDRKNKFENNKGIYADVLWWDLINSSMKATVSIDSLAISIEISTTTINMSHRIEMYDQSLISSLSHKINGSIHNR